MPWFEPSPPPYAPRAWREWPLRKRARAAAEGWALQGYGAPHGVYLFYAVKLAAYVGGWLWWCSLSSELGGVEDLGQWWAHPVAFQKAIVWSLGFEVLGLGCGSGPLTGRYWPPIGGVTYFLRPGTTKLPLVEGSRLLGGNRRGAVDTVGYASLLYCLARALVADAPTQSQLWPIVGLVALLGLRDRTLYLAARAEHYWVTIVLFAVAPNDAAWMAGAKSVQLALWFWAGVSKLNAHFPSVVGVMVSNSPFTPFAWLRRRMYRAYPDDLRPSGLARFLAHGGGALEFAVPIVLGLTALGFGFEATGAAPFAGWVPLGMALMFALHLYITSNVPMGVPIEWNVMVVYGGAMLFGAHADVELGALIGQGSAIQWLMLTFVLANTVLIPLVGNLWPARVSFLPAMRYYAGNWAYSVWFFRGESHRKLDKLTATSPWLYDQLDRFYPPDVVTGIASKVMAFRLMHLHGRALAELVPRALPDAEAYEWVDGELVAGIVLGWNFGDGHLHDERLLRAVQSTCAFEPGELRCVMVEGQPLMGSSLAWRICDAADGELDRGELLVKQLEAQQPWPEESA